MRSALKRLSVLMIASTTLFAGTAGAETIYLHPGGATANAIMSTATYQTLFRAEADLTVTSVGAFMNAQGGAQYTFQLHETTLAAVNDSAGRPVPVLGDQLFGTTVSFGLDSVQRHRTVGADVNLLASHYYVLSVAAILGGGTQLGVISEAALGTGYLTPDGELTVLNGRTSTLPNFGFLPRFVIEAALTPPPPPPPEPAVTAVPLPGAAYGGLVLLGGLGAARRWRGRDRGE